MMEFAHTFTSQGSELLSIVHPGDIARDTGVLIVVGGPQYRVGSHRQFIQLARMLASNGVTTMRFDYTGMGDSGGEKAEFEHVDTDIRDAIDAFMDQQPQLKNIVIWGLCDAASAALMYGYQDKRVTGLVLLNPWLRSDQAMGKTMIKFYYLQRLLSKDFWKKLFAGRVNVKASVKEVKHFAAESVASTKEDKKTHYQQLMAFGLNQFKGKILVILSGNDLTAKEFEQQAFSTKPWKKIKSASVKVARLPESDHTFSTRDWKQQVEQATLDFVFNM
ncbi:hydrolase 1, exosortase A system-associated [Thalassotalea atypica]|uniref:hydrolase 1, exosortase A system-associated n=1 Tax=Thalassotalea atypica TaxID=2054316 RepID=UPI00257439C4|nr:hydrolase 1, exosortase A system-associated [Thalassotalea atypica]